MLDDQIRGDMATFYKGCLCQECLQMLEDSRPPKVNLVQFLKEQLRRPR
jgi:hypothetical protein